MAVVLTRGGLKSEAPINSFTRKLDEAKKPTGITVTNPKGSSDGSSLPQSNLQNITPSASEVKKVIQQAQQSQVQQTRLDLANKSTQIERERGSKVLQAQRDYAKTNDYEKFRQRLVQANLEAQNQKLKEGVTREYTSKVLSDKYYTDKSTGEKYLVPYKVTKENLPEVEERMARAFGSAPSLVPQEVKKQTIQRPTSSTPEIQVAPYIVKKVKEIVRPFITLEIPSSNPQSQKIRTVVVQLAENTPILKDVIQTYRDIDKLPQEQYLKFGGKVTERFTLPEIELQAGQLQDKGFFGKSVTIFANLMGESVANKFESAGLPKGGIRLSEPARIERGSSRVMKQTVIYDENARPLPPETNIVDVPGIRIGSDTVRKAVTGGTQLALFTTEYAGSLAEAKLLQGELAGGAKNIKEFVISRPVDTLLLGSLAVAPVVKAVRGKQIIVESIPINSPVRNLKASEVIGTDVALMRGENLVGNQILYGEQRLSQAGSSGVRRQVSIKTNLRKLFRLDPKVVYTGVTNADKVGREKSLELLKNIGYSEKSAKTQLRFTAPQVLEQGIESGTINVGKDTAKGTITTYFRKPVRVVDDALGIKTRGGAEVKDIQEFSRQLTKEGEDTIVVELVERNRITQGRGFTKGETGDIKLNLVKSKSTKSFEVYTPVVELDKVKGLITNEARTIYSKSSGTKLFPREAGVETSTSKTTLIKKERFLPEPEKPVVEPRITSKVFRNIKENQAVVENLVQNTDGLKEIGSLDVGLGNVPSKVLDIKPTEVIKTSLKSPEVTSITKSQQASSIYAGQGTYERTDSFGGRLGIMNRGEMNIDTIKEDRILKDEMLIKGGLSIKENILMKESPIIRDEILIKDKISQKDFVAVKPTVKLAVTQSPKQQLRQLQKLELKLGLDQSTKPEPIKPKIPSKIADLDFTETPYRNPKTPVKSQLYDIFKRVRGKDVKVGSEETEFQAFEKLKKVLKSDLSASGIVKKGKTKIKPLYTDSEFGLSKLDQFRLIQLKNRRFGTQPETTKAQFFRKTRRNSFL